MSRAGARRAPLAGDSSGRYQIEQGQEYQVEDSCISLSSLEESLDATQLRYDSTMPRTFILQQTSTEEADTHRAGFKLKHKDHLPGALKNWKP